MSVALVRIGRPACAHSIVVNCEKTRVLSVRSSVRVLLSSSSLRYSYVSTGPCECIDGPRRRTVPQSWCWSAL